MSNETMKTLNINNQVVFDIFDAEAREKLKSTVKTINGRKPDENGNINLETGGGGLTTTQKSLMITLFRNMLSQSDMSDTVDELEKSFNLENSGESGGESGEDEPTTPDEPIAPTTYTVKYNLSNATSSASDTSVTSESSFTTTLTPSDGYVLGTVIVTMGGIEITDTVYNSGVINIPKVSGNIVINAVGVESGVSTNWEEGVPYTFTIIENEYVSPDDGTFKPEQGTLRTDYTPCLGASWLYFSKAEGATRKYNAFFDENKNFVSGFSLFNQNYVEIPSNVAYFVISYFPKVTSGECQVMPIGKSESTWKDGVPYTLDTFVENVYLLSGKETTYDGWKATKKLNCYNASKLVLSNASQYGSFYDKVGNVVGAWKSSTEITVPSQATYFAVSGSNSFMDSLVITPYE